MIKFQLRVDAWSVISISSHLNFPHTFHYRNNGSVIAAGNYCVITELVP